jgi:hypothetical protein
MDEAFQQLGRVSGMSAQFYGNSDGTLANAALSGGDAGMVMLLHQLPITDADMWVEAVLGGSWASSANEFMGIAVRMSLAAKTYYGFWFDGIAHGNWQLFKDVAGSRTILDSGTDSTPTAGDTYRLTVEGTSLIPYRNGVVLGTGTVTDSSITGKNDGVGIIADGLELNTRFVALHAGDLPVPGHPTYLYNNWVSNHLATEGDNCFDFGTPGETYDANTAIGLSHLSGPGHDIGGGYTGHYSEGDLGEVRRLVMFRHEGSGTPADWDDVNIKVRASESDDWNQIVTGATPVPAATGSTWKYLYLDEPVDARYIRVESKLAVGDSTWGTDEIEFWAGDLDTPLLWWLANSTIHWEDCRSAYRFKGAPSLISARANLRGYHTSTNALDVVGTPVWSAGSGFIYDNTNYHGTNYTANGGPHTFIWRFSDADPGGALPVFGDATGPGGIFIVAVDGTTFLVANQSTGTVVTVTDTTDDVVICLAGNKVYVDGTYDSDLAGYSEAAGAAEIHVGGVAGVAGSGTVVGGAIYNRVLTATEVAAITTKLQAL